MCYAYFSGTNRKKRKIVANLLDIFKNIWYNIKWKEIYIGPTGCSLYNPIEKKKIGYALAVWGK
jgi:hypothetical protein